MVLHFALTCLTALALIPFGQGTGAGVKAKAKAKAKDPWDVPDASEELEPPGGSPNGDGLSPEDQAGIIAQFQARSAAHRAQKQHAVMKQFMKNFARNMRLSVLADSRGDMPEEERQRLIAKAEAESQAESGEGGMSGFGDAGGGGGGGFAPPPPEEEDDSMRPPPRRVPRRRHMLNMAEARRVPRSLPRHRLLPEAEGIGFGPAPESMAAENQAPSVEDEAPEVDEAPPVRSPPHRHHLRMLNARPGHLGKAKALLKLRHTAQKALPPGVVRDEMGRAMPLLNFGPSPRSGATRSSLTYTSIFMCCLLLLGSWRGTIE